jgi:hypothetical protein
MHRILLFVALLALPISARAQESRSAPADTVGARVVVLLVDGTRVTGVVASMTNAELRLTTDGGIAMTIPRDQVRSLEPMSGRKFSGVDPNPTRLLFGPTARSLGSGKGYAALYEIVVPFVGVGVGDAITLAGGVTINPGSGRLAYIAPKATLVQTQTVDVAIGGFAGTFIGSDIDESPLFGIGYAVATVGTNERAFTIGLGQGYADGSASNLFALVGGELQIGNRAKLLTENYLFYVDGDTEVVFSGGIRFFGDRLSADFGLFSASGLIGEDIGFPFIPFIGFATTF